MKEKFIKVYDNIIPPILQDYYLTFAEKEIQYTYVQNLVGEGNDYYPGFVSTMYDFEYLNNTNKHRDLFIQILYNFCYTQNILVEKIFRERLFITLPSDLDLSKGIHNDLDFNHSVILYYLNDSDGDTIFFDDDKNEIKRITPKKGRIAFFDGSIPHAGNYSTKKSRLGYNVNFIGKFYE